MCRHVTCMEETRYAYKIWVRILKGRDRLEDLHVDRGVTLKWILKK
jgi:hypothetical protein